MKFEAKTVRKTINKAFLKEPVERGSFERFKEALGKLLTGIEQANEAGEREEHFKNLLPPFFKAVGFEDYKINTSSNVDLAIYTGGKTKDPLGVMMEVKRPSNKSQMISKDRLNRKAMHEAVLYYLEQRIEEENSDLKHVIITDMTHWYIFDAQEFERCFYRPSTLRKAYKEWNENRKVSSNTVFMYNEIASFISNSDATITGISLPLEPVRKLLKGDRGSEYEKRLIALYKFFSPIHLLKEPFANDSNSLNKEFYRELLYILGLEETKEGSTRYIRRVDEGNRQSGSLIENTIRILDAEDHLSTLKSARSSYGTDRDEQLFSVAMELGITWMNRILFLKLLEAQLYRYHRKDNRFKFLGFDTIDSLDELNKLFFQVLARKQNDRSENVNEKFGHIPYLNSSLFDVSDLEHQTTRISGLDDHAEMPVYSKSVLTDSRGDTLNTLDYLFRFLEAYNFSAEGSEEIRDESKSLINASVLGLIFEKINGYKDGSFYTPGFITEYMARETLRKAVLDKFVATLTDIYNKIGRDISIEHANEIINSITICDPAVGSGHFLVSCLNELLAIKSELGILCDDEGKVLRDVHIEVENDELIITHREELFEYDVLHTWIGQRLKSRKIAPETQRIQKTLFHEKRYLIENCLFGVDINPNSVKICRLRLWIELLKRAYYTALTPKGPLSNSLPRGERTGREVDTRSKSLPSPSGRGAGGEGELHVLPNIDINIKQGNSLVSRFELDSDLSSVFKNSNHSLDDYKQAVRSYKHTGDRSEKARLQKLIDDIKSEYTVTLTNLRPINQKLSKARGRLEIMQSDDLFGEVKFTKKQITEQKKKLKKLEEQKAEEESGAFYNQAFEWRFEFPEVLDDEGRFTGFDVVIGNPPYVSIQDLKKENIKVANYYKEKFITTAGNFDIYIAFIELASYLCSEKANVSLIVPSKFMSTNYGEKIRSLLIDETLISHVIDFEHHQVFDTATTYTCILMLNRTTKNSITFTKCKPNEVLQPNNDLNRILYQKLSESTWNLIDEDLSKLIDKCISNGTAMKDVPCGISRGSSTGNDKVFVLEENGNTLLNGYKEKVEVDLNSPLIIEPIFATDYSRYAFTSEHKNHLIFPYNWEDGSFEPFSEEEIHKKSPKLYKYLLEKKNLLQKRKQYKSWFLYSAARNLKIHGESDILIPLLADRGLFSITPKDRTYTLMAGGGFSISIRNSSIDSKYLLGVLNSKLIFKLLYTWSNKFRGGFITCTKQYFENLPIAIPEKSKQKSISEKVSDILKTKNQNPEADTTELESEIDRLVYELYELSEEEIVVVEGLGN